MQFGGAESALKQEKPFAVCMKEIEDREIPVDYSQLRGYQRTNQSMKVNSLMNPSKQEALVTQKGKDLTETLITYKGNSNFG